MTQDVRVLVLRRAAEIAGGPVHLRSRLGVEQHALDLWLAGRATPPEAVFLAAVDVVLRDDLARATDDRRRNPRTVAGASGSEGAGSGPVTA
jgi:hypothetical protein